MASLSLARPGKFSARQYLGDLAGLFERQRRRAGVALTPESFASDLAGNDTLRSSLFTLCSAISHMGESDLSPEELLDLIARALCGAGSAEGETGTRIPDDMREAFLSGYTAWQNRDLQPTGPDGAWPPAASGARKPPAREFAPEAMAQEQAAAVGAAAADPAVPVPTSGRRTLQEAISMARDHAASPEPFDPDAALPRDAHSDTGSMTLGELKHFLEEIEIRVSRIGPHIQQLKSAAQEPARRERERPAFLPGGVIPFPDRRGNSADGADDDPSPSDFHQDGFARRRPVPMPNLRAEDAFLTQTPNADDRPPGIDALLAAAPAWAKAMPTARSVDEDAFLSRHAYLSPARRPGTLAPASLYYAETPAQPLAPPTAVLPAEPGIAPTVAPALAPAPPALPFTAPALAPPRIGLDAEDDPLLSPMERLQASLQQLPPRKVFLYLASLTVLAGGLAGLMAYRTLHPRLRQFKDLQTAVPFDATPTASPAPIASSAPATPVAPPLQTVGNSSAKPATPQGPVATLPRPKLHVSPTHQPPVAVWPPVPQQIAREPAPAPPATVPASTAPAPPSQPAPSGPLYVPAPTMIGYALATPQPVYPAQANGASGTVTVEITISRLGDVTNARAVSGPAELRGAAVAAVRGWRFRPYLVSGTPAVVSTTLQFFFSGP